MGFARFSRLSTSRVFLDVDELRVKQQARMGASLLRFLADPATDGTITVSRSEHPSAPVTVQLTASQLPAPIVATGESTLDALSQALQIYEFGST